MTWESADAIHRTAKILTDKGLAKDPEQARQMLQAMVLQVAVGADIEDDPAAQAALATLINAGTRAFLGGVRVHLDADPVLMTGWTADLTATQVVEKYGGTLVDDLDPSQPTVVIGRPQAVGHPVLYLGWHGWTAGVASTADSVPRLEAIAVAGVAAAALAISECFQHQLGDVYAGRRSVGVSLWRPDRDWTDPDAVGPALNYLPKSLWLLGLGHLGQAYAWTLGMLPYPRPNDVELCLMDFDVVVEGNTATQLLVQPRDVGILKTRVVSGELARLGISTRLVERAFDEHFRVCVGANPRRNEPTTALAGFDKREPRQRLGDAGFSRIVDAGLGKGPVEYLDMVLHTFPATDAPADAFAAPVSTSEPLMSAARLLPAYEAEVARRVAHGLGEAAARCGLIDVAGVTVGAAFVGAFASTLVVADVLRELQGGFEFSVIALDLRDPAGLTAVEVPPRATSTPYTAAKQNDPSQDGLSRGCPTP